MSDKKTLYSSPEVAEMLGRSDVTIRKLAQRKGIGQKIGPAWVFTAADIAELAKVDPRGGKFKADGSMTRRAGYDKIKNRGPRKKTPPAEPETPDKPDESL